MTIVAPADQQARERIHDDLDATLFVEAGAGTGKTRELIERILRLVISGKARLRHIAAITFTEAAAAELRDRVRQRLEDALRDGADLSLEEQERCSAALAELDAAAIETLHGFAQRILADHPLEAGLPPLVEIQDEIQASIAFDERWAVFVDELLGDEALQDVLLQAFALGVNVADLRDIALRLHQHWDRLEHPIDVPALPAPVDPTMLAHRLEQVCDGLQHCSDEEDRLYQHLVRVDAYRKRLAAATSDLDRLRVLGEPIKLGTQGGNKVNWRGMRPDEVRDALKQADNLRATLLSGTRSALLSHLLAALARFTLQYADERRREGRLEFHDLLVRARDLLRDDAGVRRAARRAFTHILIDEFQDTDPLQIEIATLIASEDPPGGPPRWSEASVEPGRLFFVGDPKQSIYRFRRADIDLYTAAQQRFAAGTVHLTQNFRSTQPVIDWVNALFADLLDAGAGDGQVPYVALDASWPALDGVSVRVIGAPHEENVARVREREAREIAEAIQAVKAERWPVIDAHGDGRRTPRDAKFKDIAILLPTRTTLPHIEQALEDAGVPYRIESRSLVYDTQEVRDLLAILRSLDDPTDEVALIAALRSPAFACGDDDLLRYQQARGRWDYRHPPDGLPDGDPVVAAMTALHGLHRRRWWEPISGVVEAVIRERRLFELSFSRRRPRERWQRLRFVLDQARAFAEAGGRTLRQFIEWAERQATEGTRVIETVVPDPDDDAVRIMTIHAAKGLEFPIVVMAGLNLVESSRAHQSDVVLWGDDDRPEARIGEGGHRFESAGYAGLDQREEVMDRQEKVRLLYVAATRARDHLIVSLHHGTRGTSHASRLFERCQRVPELWRPIERLARQEAFHFAAEPSVAPFEDSRERFDGWRETRQERIEALAGIRAASATEIAQRLSGAVDDPNLAKDTPVEEVPPWRRGRAGTAFGRAVHAVLQSIDLATGADLDGAARAQAAAEGIADRADDIAATVRTALDAPSVREAAQGGRYWRELYVGAPVDGVLVEGFVDLLYETPEGLVVVDYKTDTIPDDAAMDAALARYRPQGAAYALALQEALDRPVARCVFLFVQPRRARERVIGDLEAAVREVRERLRGWDGER